MRQRRARPVNRPPTLGGPWYLDRAITETSGRAPDGTPPSGICTLGTVEPDDTRVGMRSPSSMSEWRRSRGTELALVDLQRYLDPRIRRSAGPVVIRRPAVVGPCGYNARQSGFPLPTLP